jgi:DeoR family glycerol-3-phosphate regulon repressor
MQAGAEVAAMRHRAILETARNTGSVSVETLADTLGVTPQTIRKDLNLLAKKSMLARVHGGAVVTSGIGNLHYAERRLIAAETKDAIGVAAAALVPNGASLFINIGSTTEAIARHLTGHRELMVITNNLNVVAILADCPGIEVIAAGGRVRPGDRAVIGALTMDFIRSFRVDYALIGASAIERDGTFLDFDLDEVILTLDSSKLGRPAPVRIGGLEDIDYLISDDMDDDLRAACDAARVTMVRVV